jgi:acyl phosphate:glycerol-3-phosphate acyltransferase
MLELGLKALLAYLLGSLNGALVVGLASGIDIRKSGSGNAGGTNALRTQGKWFAARVMLIDVGKGILPPLLLPGLLLPGIPLDTAIDRDWLTVACAAAAVVGHCYPVFFDFAGGKGAATAVGALGGMAPGLLLPGAIVWFGVLFATGYVGLATMLAAAAVPAWLLVTGVPVTAPVFVFAVLLALFIVYTHRGNVRRLLAGQENRLEKARLFRRARSAP